MKKMRIIRRLLLSVLAVAALVATTVPAHATFIIDPNPGGEKFFIDVANKDVNSFSGHVGANNSGPIVNVSTIGNVDTGSGYSNIKPVKDGLLTDLIFTPADNTKYKDFSFRGQIEKDGFTGEVDVKVTDQIGSIFSFDFTIAKADADFDRIGVVSYDGEWIKSVEIFTPGSESFKEVKQINFSRVPEPSTFLLLGAGLGGLWIWRRRK
jgi:hypothetical protein